MVEDGSKSYRCRFCNSTFSEDILNKINNKKEDVYCENCGDIIKRVRDDYDFSSTKNIENEAKTNLIDVPVKPQINIKPHPDALNYPIGRVFYDTDFPLIFKSNFIIVFSRLTCFHALYLEREGQIQLGESEIPENALNDLYMSTRHVQDMQIQPEFLNDLHEISKDEFERNLKQLQAKIQSNRQYLEDFHVYTRWLIREVYLLISDEVNVDDLSKFNLTIYKDLENQREIFEKNFVQLKSSPKKETKQMKKARANFKINTLNEIQLLTVGYEKSELLFKIACVILDDALTGSKKFSFDELPQGCKTNSIYIASSLTYYSLRHIDYNTNFPKYEIYGVFDYVREFYPDSTTMKTAIINIIPKLYDFLSDSLKEKILYYPRKNYKINEIAKSRVEEIKNLKKSEVFLSDLKIFIYNFSKKLPSSIKCYNLALSILMDALEPPNQFSYHDLIDNSRWFATPKFYAIPFLFFAYNHIDFRKSKSLNISDFSDKYFVGYKKSNQGITSFIFKYLSTEIKEKIQYKPQEIYDPKKNFNEHKMWEYFDNIIEIFVSKNHKLYLEHARLLYTSAISRGFKTNTMITKHPKYLATALVYFILLKEGKKDITKKEMIKKIKIKGYNLDYTIYKVIKHFSQYVDIKQKLSKYDELAFKEELLEIYNYNEEISREDNLILLDLIITTLEFYENQFEKLKDDLTFIAKKRKPSAILEKLANVNVFNSEVNLMDFVSNYGRLIESLQIDNKKKENLHNYLNRFESARRDFYKYEEKKTRKFIREQKRYSEYGDSFYSMENRVRKFIILLGFSPYDGFDIWNNKKKIKGTFRIYANFHHYHYNPVDQSDDDLVFIPVKPPKKYQNNGGNYLTHNMIAGREGNLKRTDISNETRKRNAEELKSIEEIIGYNSSLIEKAVFTLNSDLLNNLRGWGTISIKKIKERLKDKNFLWCKGIEKYIPSARGHKNERINAKNTAKIIQGIINLRA